MSFSRAEALVPWGEKKKKNVILSLIQIGSERDKCPFLASPKMAHCGSHRARHAHALPLLSPLVAWGCCTKLWTLSSFRCPQRWSSKKLTMGIFIHIITTKAHRNASNCKLEGAARDPFFLKRETGIHHKGRWFTCLPSPTKSINLPSIISQSNIEK